MTEHLLEYAPHPTLAKIFEATTATRFIFALGPIGSGKTSAALFFLLQKAAMQAPSPDGLRRSRFAVVRSTISGLKQTVLRDIQNLFGPLADYRPSSNTVLIHVGDLRCEIILVPLETPADQKRLLSLQLSGVFINEAREIPLDLILAAFSRCGRFPSAKAGGVECSHRFLIADSNMGVEGSDLYNFLEVDPPPSPALLYVHQPSAFAPEATWRQWLPTSYYEDAMLGQTEQWIRQHLHAEWGDDLSGEPVFGAAFNPAFHVSPNPLQTIQLQPLLVGLDPGFSPAAVIAQLDMRGQLRVYRELHAVNCLFGTFIDEHLAPVLQSPGFSLIPCRIICDPAAVIRNAMTGLSPYGFLKARGLHATLASTNDVQARIRGLERFLVETRGSGSTSVQSLPAPALLLDPSCIVLADALRSKYRYKKHKVTGQLDAVPEKRHPISDVTDALGYITVGLGGGKFLREASRLSDRRPEARHSPSVPALAWT